MKDMIINPIILISYYILLLHTTA